MEYTIIGIQYEIEYKCPKCDKWGWCLATQYAKYTNCCHCKALLELKPSIREKEAK